MSRAINEVFMNDLLEGKLKGLLDEVHKDDTLCLELRGNEVVIYYRGGALYTIKKEKDDYTIEFNTSYCKNGAHQMVIEKPDIEHAITYLPYYKQAMDYNLGSGNKREREFQQLIIRENNNTKDISTASDYFILDMEYVLDNKEAGRYDMVALKWKSTSSERRNKDNIQLAIMEMKYGDSAKDNLQKHIDDFVELTKSKDAVEELCKDMEKVFGQKCKLGLIKGYNGKDDNITISREKPELVLVFANHDPDKKGLKQELQAAIEAHPEYEEQIVVAKASGMGYGLYAYDHEESRFPNIKEYCNK